MTWLRALTPLAWALIAAALLAVVLLTLTFCSAKERADSAASKAGADAAFAEGRAAAGADAVDVVTDNAAEAAAIDRRVEEGEDAIRKAAPGQRDGATVRELCRSPSARRRPECAVQRPPA